MLMSADWSDLTPRLLLVARFCLSQYGRSEGRHGRRPGQFVLEAVMDVVEGRYEPQLVRSPFAVIAPRICYLIRIDAEGKEW